MVHTTTCPVLLVPPPPAERAVFSWRRVVCPVDFSPASVRALACAVALAEDGAPVTVLHVVELPADDDGEAQHVSAYRRSRLEQARTALERMLQSEGRGRPLDEQLRAGKPSLELLRAALEMQADLLVLGAQGRGAGDAAAFGPTAQHIVRNTVCPVLTVPAVEAAAAPAPSGVSLPRPR